MAFAKLLSGRVAKVSGSDLSTDRYDYIKVSESEPDFGHPSFDNGIFSSRLSGERRFLYPSTGLVVDNATGNITVDFTSVNFEVTDTDSGYTWSETGTITADSTASIVKIVSGDDINVDVDTTNDAIRISHENTSNLTGIYGGNGIAGITVDSNGHITDIVTGTYDNFRTIEVTDTDSGYTWASEGSLVADDQTDTLTFVSGIYVDVDVDSSNDAIRVTHNDTVRNDTTSIATPNYGDTFGVVDSVTTNSQGHVTGVNFKTVSMPTTDDTDTTYSISAETSSGNAVLRLTGSDSTTDEVSFVGGGITAVTRSDADTITITSTEVDTLDSVTSRGNTTTNTIGVGSLTIDTTTVFLSKSTTLSTTAQTPLNLYSSTTYVSAKILIQVNNTVSGERQMSEFLVIHDGSTAKATEYGIIFTGASPIAFYDVDVSGGNVRLLITGASANSTEYKITEILSLA